MKTFLKIFSCEPPGSELLLAASSTANLPSVVSALSRVQQSELGSGLLKSIRAASQTDADAALRAAASVLLLFLADKKSPTPPDMRFATQELHDALPRVSNAAARNSIIRTCEIFWLDGREGRERSIEQAFVALVEKSLAEESGGVSTAADVKRVYALREATSSAVSGEKWSPHARALLVRCATSAMYLRISEGQKFIAHLLASGVDEIHSALLSMLPCVRKSRAHACAMVYIYAWKQMGSDPFKKYLEDIATKATRAAVDPLATNLRTVLSSFHASKRIAGMDEMLHAVYTPILFRSLAVANPLVRRNSAIILADSFPVHDPGMSIVELEAVLSSQCGKLYTLLEDPVPFVRVTAIEGACRVLGLLWEIVPASSAKRMIELLTGSLAFDKSSANVRIAVCDGLRFMLDNHQTHPVLSVALRRLGNLLNDRTERVRVAFLELLVALKSKRIVSARYFDIAPLDDLLVRLPIDSPVVASRIMKLLVTSYFPLERKNKTREEIAASQLRACVELLKHGAKPAEAFYRNLSMYVPPGPLVEFCIRVATLAMDIESNFENLGPDGGSKSAIKRQRRSQAKTSGPDPNTLEKQSSGRRQVMSPKIPENRSANESQKPKLLKIVAIVMLSIAPSLEKPSNVELRDCIIQIFGGGSLKPLALKRNNSEAIRLTAFKIAASMNQTTVKPVVELWQQEMRVLLPQFCDVDIVVGTDWLRELLHCGLRWKKIDAIAEFLAACTEAARTGQLRDNCDRDSRKRLRVDADHKIFSPQDIRLGAVQALSVTADLLAEDYELLHLLRICWDEELNLMDIDSETVKSCERRHFGAVNCDTSRVVQIISSPRKGIQNAIEAFIICGNESTVEYGTQVALTKCLAASLTLSLSFARDCGISHSTENNRWSVTREAVQVTQWLVSPSICNAVFRDYHFGCALACTLLAKVVDCIALGKFSMQSGKEALHQFCSNIASKFSASRNATMRDLQFQPEIVFAMDLVRACYHFILHSQLSTECETDLNQEKIQELETLLTNAVTILANYTARTPENSAEDSEMFSSRFSEFLACFTGCECSNRLRESVTVLLANAVYDQAREWEKVNDDVPLLVHFIAKAIINSDTKTNQRECAKGAMVLIRLFFDTLLSRSVFATAHTLNSFTKILSQFTGENVKSYPCVTNTCQFILTCIEDIENREGLLDALAETLGPTKELISKMGIDKSCNKRQLDWQPVYATPVPAAKT